MVRTRFAPSPTGYLHIGGVRTALFNWLFARKHGGQFILRIDDTDKQRNVEEALAPILDGFRWLKIDWDEGPEVGGPHAPYFQSQRLDRYQAAVQELLNRGHAYRDYASPEEIQEERKTAEKEKRQFVYSRRWMADTPEKQRAFESEGRKAVVRLKMPREGTLAIDDLVRGRVEFDWAREQDHVIQRADGSCLYHLATVVDDHDFEITHVIRAEEHLSNTPRQIFILQSLGYELPYYAHLPYVAEPGSKIKLSKRKIDKYIKNPAFKKVHEYGMRNAEEIHRAKPLDTFNPVLVDYYECLGYLPDAIVNYLLLLGWSLDDKTEIFTRDEMIQSFSLDRVIKSPASFDPEKLFAFQQRYMRLLPLEEKMKLMLPRLQNAGLIADPAPSEDLDKLREILEAVGDRITLVGDIGDYSYFFQADDEFEYDEKSFEKRLRKPPEAAGLLRELNVRLAAAVPFKSSALEDVVKDFVSEKGIKTGEVIHALRVAVTGKSVGLGMFETLAILGKDSSRARIARALELVNSCA